MTHDPNASGPNSSGPTGAPLTVLVAPSGPAGGVRDALVDLSAAGWLRDLLWVDAAGIGDRQVAALRVAGGRTYGTTVEQALSGARYARVRVLVVVPLLPGADPVPAALEQRVQQLVLATAQTRVELLRVLLTRPDAPARADVAQEGWHNLMISPEDSRGPGLGRAVLTASDDPVGVGVHAATVIAGVGGLWAGVDEAPLDDQNPPPGRTVRLVRSHYRRWSAAEVERAVRAGVLATDDGLPLPRQAGAAAVHVDDVALATSTMATALWTKHREVLRGPRATVTAEVAREIGGKQAFSMMLGFLWNSIKLSPQRWYASVVHTVSSATAKVTHEMVFGAAPSSYNVVVGGVRADGNAAGWQDLAAAAGEMAELLNRGAPGELGRHQARHDLSSVMQDYVAGARTLADGGEHAAGLPPVQVGPDRGVLREAADCAPGPDEELVIPPHLVDHVGQHRLHPADLLGIQTTRGRLAVASRNQHLAVETDRTDAEIQGWQQRHARSYPVQVGMGLVGQIQATAGEVRELLGSIRAAGQVPDLSGEIQARQQRLALYMRILLGLFVGFVVLDVVAVINTWIRWDIAIGIGVGIFALWGVLTGALFFTGQRALFGELHRRRLAGSQAEVNQQNLRHASTDLQRLTELYGHYLTWSRITGAALAAPFGPPPAEGADPAQIGDGLPMSTRSATAVVQPEQVSRAVVTLRRDLYRIGWTSLPWQQLLTEAAGRVGPEAYEYGERPERWFGSPPGPGSLLDRWAGALEGGGTHSAAGEQVWSYVVGLLEGSRTDLGDALITQVRPGHGGAAGLVSMTDFLAGIDQPTETMGPQAFDNSVLAVHARMGSLSRVARHWQRTAASGLGRTVVLVQLSDGFPDYELAVLDQTGVGPGARLGSEDAAQWTF